MSLFDLSWRVILSARSSEHAITEGLQASIYRADSAIKKAQYFLSALCSLKDSWL